MTRVSNNAHGNYTAARKFRQSCRKRSRRRISLSSDSATWRSTPVGSVCLNIADHRDERFRLGLGLGLWLGLGLLCLLMHLVHNNRASSYLVDSVTATASLSHRGRLRSASSQRYEQPRTRLKYGERCFAFAGPAAWNSLPSSVQELTDTTAFKHQLKTVLFQRCYSSST